MGRIKQDWIESQERGYSLPELKEKYVCANHFDDSYLKQYINKNSISGTCSYCGKKKKVIDLNHLMGYIVDKIMSYYGNPSDEGLYLASSFFDDDKERIPGFQRVGCYVTPSFAHNYESTKELFYDINLTTDSEVLDNDMESCFINDEWIQHTPYMMSESQELSFMWKTFQRMVKHEQRFTFFKRPEFTGEEVSNDNGLMDILTELGAQITAHNLYSNISAGTELYRCRFINEGETVNKFDEITSSPDNKAKQSRMSPAGISMFYGAFDKKTAIVESSPDGEGTGKYVIGKFNLKKNLIVLDLTKLPKPSFWIGKDWEGIEFLHSFNREITKRIERDDRIHIDYIPSQVFTEYLRYIHRLPNGKKIDGIIYKSSLKSTDNNIVLFYNQRSSSDVLELVEIT